MRFSFANDRTRPTQGDRLVSKRSRVQSPLTLLFFGKIIVWNNNFRLLKIACNEIKNRIFLTKILSKKVLNDGFKI